VLCSVPTLTGPHTRPTPSLSSQAQWPIDGPSTGACERFQARAQYISHAVALQKAYSFPSVDALFTIESIVAIHKELVNGAVDRNGMSTATGIRTFGVSCSDGTLYLPETMVEAALANLLKKTRGRWYDVLFLVHSVCLSGLVRSWHLISIPSGLLSFL
jgi:Na+-translocating ferredoxin:NAD+ oxidoreductase RnfD subunit